MKYKLTFFPTTRSPILIKLTPINLAVSAILESKQRQAFAPLHLLAARLIPIPEPHTKIPVF